MWLICLFHFCLLCWYYFHCYSIPFSPLVSVGELVGKIVASCVASFPLIPWSYLFLLPITGFLFADDLGRDLCLNINLVTDLVVMVGTTVPLEVIVVFQGGCYSFSSA